VAIMVVIGCLVFGGSLLVKSPVSSAIRVILPPRNGRRRTPSRIDGAGTGNIAVNGPASNQPGNCPAAHLSPKTMRNYTSNIFAKLQVADRAEAIIRAREAGIGS
jgi:hypothetical protein